MTFLWPHPTKCDLSYPNGPLWPQQSSCDLGCPLVTLADLIRPQLNSYDLSRPHMTFVTSAVFLRPQPSSCDLSRPLVTFVDLKWPLLNSFDLSKKGKEVEGKRKMKRKGKKRVKGGKRKGEEKRERKLNEGEKYGEGKKRKSKMRVGLKIQWTIFPTKHMLSM